MTMIRRLHFFRQLIEARHARSNDGRRDRVLSGWEPVCDRCPEGLPTRYDVAPNGDRFLLRYHPADPGPPITVVINWTSALAK